MRRCASSSARKKARPFFVFFLPSLFDDDLIPLFFEFSVCVLDLFSFVLPRRPRRSTRRSTKAASLLPPPPSSPPGALPRPPPPPPGSSFSAPLPAPLAQKTEHVGNAREAVDALAAFVSISSEAAPKASAEPRALAPSPPPPHFTTAAAASNAAAVAFLAPSRRVFCGDDDVAVAERTQAVIRGEEGWKRRRKE